MCKGGSLVGRPANSDHIFRTMVPMIVTIKYAESHQHAHSCQAFCLQEKVLKELNPSKCAVRAAKLTKKKSRLCLCGQSRHIIGFRMYFRGGGICHKRQKSQASTPRAPIRNRQTRKVANAKVLNHNTNLT